MPGFGSHISGPIRHTTRFRDQGDRAWFRNLPVGMNDPDFVHHFLDFEKVDDYNTTNYSINSSGTGTSAAVNTAANGLLGSSAMSVNGALLIQTGSTAGNYCTVQSKVLGWQLDNVNVIANMLRIQDSKELWFEASFSADVSASDVDVFVGLSETANSVIGPGVSGNYIGFNVSSSGYGNTNLIKYIASSASTVTKGVLATGSGNSVTLAQGTLTKVGFAYSGSNVVDFYINRNYINSIVLPGIPTSPLALTYQITTSSPTNRSLVLDYVYCAKTR